MRTPPEVTERLYTPAQVAELLGVNVHTVRYWGRIGKIACVKTPGGHRRIPQSVIDGILGKRSQRSTRPRVAIYSRVSTKKQADMGNLGRQKERLLEYAVAQGYDIVAVFSEMASGVNEKRRELAKLLDLVFGRKLDVVIVEYRDRLARFGYEYLERTLRAFDVRIEVLEQQEKEQTEELAEDLMSIVSSFAARLYGSRGGKAAKKMLEDLLRNHVSALNLEGSV